MNKTPPDTMVDHAAMLLSTDWFVPYWPVIGLEAHEQKQCFQSGCRDIVQRMVGKARDYYLIDFSSDRIEKTRDDLRLLVRNCKLDEAAAIRIEELVTSKPGREQLGKTAWLFHHLQGELLKDQALDEQIKPALTRSRSKFSFVDEVNFEEICLQSSTAWDGYIRSLTPELPASLAYLVSTDLLAIAELSDVLKQLTTAQRQRLHARFRIAAKSLTGVERERDWSGAEP